MNIKTYKDKSPSKKAYKDHVYKSPQRKKIYKNKSPWTKVFKDYSPYV